jgi:uncharacterized protein (TIGR03089 family)
MGFPELLAEQLRRSGSRPLVTFYDDATGERVELSVVTYANWVAKTASLLQDELDAERGGTVLVDLPPHWLGPVWLGAAWSMGMAVAPDVPAGEADVVVCGPDGVEAYVNAGPPVVALSLAPMAARFAAPVPPGVTDYGAVVWSQPDAFLPDDPPSPDDVAWRQVVASVARTQAELLADISAGIGGARDAERVLTDVDPVSPAGIECLLGPLASGGGTVWVRHPDPAAWSSRLTAEQATREVRREPVPKESGQPRS